MQLLKEHEINSGKILVNDSSLRCGSASPKKSRFTEEQIVGTLKQGEAG